MATAELSIRRATDADLPVLHTLLRHYYREGGVQLTEDDRALRTYLNLPQFGFFLAEASNAPAEAGKTIAGCVLYRSLESIPHAAECKRLFVLPEFRGRSIASHLMDAIEDAARAAGLRWLYLDSKDDFQAAIAMYRRRGYGECERYNDNPEATIFLRKRLRD
jgi:ribosomal protein S18 acetylase RimI-like enzyme